MCHYLTTREVNEYGAGHVNKNVPANESYYQTAYNQNGYGGMQYYSSLTCGYNGTDWIYDGCINEYSQSEIKYVVDAWASAKVTNGLEEARLITYEELTDNLGYEKKEEGIIYPSSNGETPSWVYNNQYSYRTMSIYQNSESKVWNVYNVGYFYDTNVGYYNGVVRPVIVLSKSVL